MPRYALLVEYDGTNFVGWQMQKGCISVQETLHHAIHLLTGEHVTIAGAGRTDKGVHATGQVAHVDLKKIWSPDQLRKGINFYLKNKFVVVVAAQQVPDDFHARFSARTRSYTYTICHRPSPIIYGAHHVWWTPHAINMERMHMVWNMFIGTHNFSHFRHKDCQSASPIKTVDHTILHHTENTITCHVTARSFLHRQVRMMVGAAITAGRYKLDVECIQRMLADPSSCKVPFLCAPAQGLCLVRVTYPLLMWKRTDSCTTTTGAPMLK